MDLFISWVLGYATESKVLNDRKKLHVAGNEPEMIESALFTLQYIIGVQTKKIYLDHPSMRNYYEGRNLRYASIQHNHSLRT